MEDPEVLVLVLYSDFILVQYIVPILFCENKFQSSNPAK